MRYALLICDDETASPTSEELRADPVPYARWGGVEIRPLWE